jgi:DNA-binding LytR/AlgR family response regulator
LQETVAILHHNEKNWFLLEKCFSIEPEGGKRMKLIFKTDPKIAAETALIFTHPQEQGLKQQLETAMALQQKSITAINSMNNRNVQVPLRAVLIVESEERMCNLRLDTGALYLYPKRLKYAEADFINDGFIRINNQTLINIKAVNHFAPTSNARIELTLTDGSTYFISRHYIKNFRRALS